MLHDKIQLALLFAVEVVQRKAVGGQLLRGGVFEHGAVVDVGFAVQQRQLDAVGVGGRQQPDVAQKQLEQVALAVQAQRQGGFLDIVGGQRHARVGQPQKAVAVAAQLEILMQVFQDKPLVFGVQLAGDQVKNIFQIQLFLRVVAGDILFVQRQNRLLHLRDLVQIAGAQIAFHRRRHTAHQQIQPKQLHHFLVDHRLDLLFLVVTAL